ncbi:MAG: protein SCO1/2 [Candidatus Krumholzibacteriia bacterium]|jgi:protein SCO1/2
MLTNKSAAILAVVLGLFLVVAGCADKAEREQAQYQCPMKCEGDVFASSPGSCPVCKMDLEKVASDDAGPELANGEITEASIFNLTSQWHTQNNDVIELKDLRGEVLVVVMIYTSCQAACPRLVADMRNIHGAVQDKTVRYILVSIDPKTDTPARLKEFAIANEMDNPQWTFLQGSVDDVREFSNVLAVKYRKISPLDFSHSNIISVFDQQGELEYQQEGLGVDNTEIVAAVKELLN